MTAYFKIELLIFLGAISILLARRPRLKYNYAVFRLARFSSLRYVRALLFWGGVLMLVLGLVMLGLAMTDASG